MHQNSGKSFNGQIFLEHYLHKTQAGAFSEMDGGGVQRVRGANPGLFCIKDLH